MKLNMFERIVALELLPNYGGYADLKEIRKAREILSLTPEDYTAVDFDPKTENYDRKKAAEHIVELPVTEWTTNTLKTILIQKEQDKKLTEKEFTLYEKIVVEE